MDEFEVIEAIISRAGGKRRPGYPPIGDDVALVPIKRQADEKNKKKREENSKLVLKCDMLVARTDVPPGMTWRQAGRKSVAMCVSDFAAKGVRPDSFMLSIGLPKGMDDGEIIELAHGFGDAKDEWKLSLIGGDTNETDDVVVDCVMLGFTDSIVKRDSAKPGELVVVTGDFGLTSAGLKILLEGAKSDPAFREAAVKSACMPSPRLRVGLALREYLTSSMDSSDGLAICLHTIAEMSRVRVVVEELPYPASLERFAALNGYDLEEMVLYGGEEYEIVGTIPPARIDEARRVARSMGCTLRVVGHTTSAAERRRESVTFVGGKTIEKRGWIHLNED